MRMEKRRDRARSCATLPLHLGCFDQFRMQFLMLDV
jgi:hypothetical protein